MKTYLHGAVVVVVETAVEGAEVQGPLEVIFEGGSSTSEIFQNDESERSKRFLQGSIYQLSCLNLLPK